MSQQYYSLVTDTGVALMTTAQIQGTKLDIKYIAVGDGGGAQYAPTKEQTTLKNEVWRGLVSKCEVDPLSPDVIKVSGGIPADVGGWTIREVGIITEGGELIIIANMPDNNKVPIADGVVGELDINVQIVLDNTDMVNIMVDPSVITATKKDLEKHSADPTAHGLLAVTMHMEDNTIHVSADDRTNWDGAHTQSGINKTDIASLEQADIRHDGRLGRLEDALFNDIIGNPWLLNFANLDGVNLINGCYNQALQRLEC